MQMVPRRGTHWNLVMLDFDLAEIYGFSTSAFNQQVKRNIDRFDEDFLFQISREELEQLSISQIV
ncbi:MAG: ORF6N domain-containing protein, partial [Clostridia bacterium]